MQIIIAVAMVVVGYLFGSVSFAILIGRAVASIDIRTVGNRNPGAANVSRNVGRAWGFLVFFLDVFKGMAPVLLTGLVFQPESAVLKHAVQGLAGAAAVLGHRRPVYYGFKGGGAVATAIGAMLCFGVKGGLEGGRALLNRLRLITMAVSLGGVESLIQHPASMTHAGVPREERLAAGITDELVRLSVGCEDVEDLIADLDQALQGIS